MVKKIGIIGLGDLGLPLAVLFAEKFEVYAVDVNESRIKQIINREISLEPNLHNYLSKNLHKIKFSTDYTALKECDVVFITVQTPPLTNRKFNLQHVESTIKIIHKIKPYCLCVIVSIINIGDVEKLRKIHPRIVYAPEFIMHGSIIHNFFNPKFTLVGAYNEKDGLITANIWRTIHNKPIYIVNPSEAEIIKLGLSLKSAIETVFTNVIKETCETFNADPNIVLNIIYKEQGNKPEIDRCKQFFPNEVSCFNQICIEKNLQLGNLLAAVVETINHLIIEKNVQKIMKYGKVRIGFLGLASNTRIPYIHKLQTIKIAKKLIEHKHELYIYDNLIGKEAEKILNNKKVHFCSSPEEVIEKSEIIFIGTQNYRNIKSNKPIINLWP